LDCKLFAVDEKWWNLQSTAGRVFVGLRLENVVVNYFREWRRKAHRCTGHSIVEYAVIVFLVAMLAVLVLRNIGTTTNNSITPVDNALQ
jgi:Flp pilus assembly pilin Flp